MQRPRRIKPKREPQPVQQTIMASYDSAPVAIALPNLERRWRRAWLDAVQDERRGLVHHSMARTRQSQRQLDVLRVCEERLVESSDASQHVGTDQEATAA